MATSTTSTHLPSSLASASNRSNPRNPFVPQTTHANGHTPSAAPPSPSLQFDPSNLPHGSRSLSGISLRAGLLGLALGISLSLSLLLAAISNPLWRAPFFIASLALFHFLEFFTTARYNPSVATISAFLLSQNGIAYNIAHSLAFQECVFSHTYLRDWQFVSEPVRTWLTVLGFTMLVVGQVVRTTAMVQAGSNFNHTVQWQKKTGHELVTSGIYGWLRHPSYFGFFWWGLGTQAVLGNTVCFVGYAVVLWRFFSHRIESESNSPLCCGSDVPGRG